MKTTLVLQDDLFMLAKKKAAERKTSLSKLVEESLRHLLVYSKKDKKAAVFRFKLPVVDGKPIPGVDISDRDSLYDKMEG